MRISDPAGYGDAIGSALGSGEPGAILFRAAGQLIVNAAFSDGFAAPPDSKSGDQIAQDSGWGGALVGRSAERRSVSSLDRHGDADKQRQDQHDGGRAAARRGDRGGHQLRYVAGDIAELSDHHQGAADVSANVVVPFAATLVAPAGGYVVPAGGFVATAALVTPAQSFARGDFVPGGTILPSSTVIGANSVLPFGVQVAAGTVVPPGTLLNIFSDPDDHPCRRHPPSCR